MVVAVSAANDPFLAERVRALFPSAVALTIASSTLNRAASFLFASRPSTVTDTKALAFLHVGTPFEFAQLATAVRLAQLPALRGAIAIRYTTQDFTTVTTTALVDLTDLAAAFDNALAPTTMSNAEPPTEVVLCAAQHVAALTGAFVFRADTATKRPVLAALSLAFLAPAVGFAEATASIHFFAVLSITLLATTMGDAETAAYIAFLTALMLTESASTVRLAEPSFHPLVLASINRTQRLPAMS